MQTKHYRVLYRGKRVADMPTEQVLANLVGLGLGEEQARRLLNSRSATLKRGLSRIQAEKYQQRLLAAGLEVEIEAEQEQLATAPAAPAEAPVAEPARFEAREPTRTPEQEAPTRKRVERIRFTGSGGEYFGIWIVNILLMMVTLGFYAPWAKVRNNQYFYGHTLIDGTSFQYLADPWVIFRGRLVAIGAVIVWVVVGELLPLLSLGMILLFLLALPWIVIRSLKFHALNSAWRNIRFDFNASYSQAFMVLVVWPLLSLLTLLLLTPFSAWKSQQFMIDNARFGQMPFRFKASAGDYYLFFLKILGIVLGIVLVSALASSLVSPLLSIVVGMVGYLILFGFFMASLTNLAMNSTALGMHGFRSQLGKRRMVWIYFSNTFLIALTLGLFTPWAKVRMARYRAECTSVLVHGDLDGFIAAEHQHASAVGQELGDAFDLGVSFV